MADNDYLQVQDDIVGAVLARVGVNVFPPPERVWMVAAMTDIEQGHLIGFQAWLGTWEELNKASFNPDVGLCVTELVRKSHSQIPEEDAREMTHVARGALYVPVGEGD